MLQSQGLRSKLAGVEVQGPLPGHYLLPLPRRGNLWMKPLSMKRRGIWHHSSPASWGNKEVQIQKPPNLKRTKILQPHLRLRKVGLVVLRLNSSVNLVTPRSVKPLSWEGNTKWSKAFDLESPAPEKSTWHGWGSTTRGSREETSLRKHSWASTI